LSFSFFALCIRRRIKEVAKDHFGELKISILSVVI
jgi:hypothetical protein